MDFSLTQEQSAVFDMAKGFAAERIAPFAAQWEDEGAIPRDVLEAAGALGLGGIVVSAEHGGSELTRLDGTLAFEAMAAACPSTAAFISIHNMCAWMIDAFGSAEMRARLLPDMCRMTKIASYCLTEPGAGSDAAALKTRAEQTNTGFRLNGTKAFISGGDFSDLYVVMCRTGGEGPKGISAVLVESGRAGLSFGAQERKMGWRGQPTAQVILEDCEIPAENLIGGAGDGFKYAMAGLDGGRLNIAACSLGAAQAAFEKALDYTGERKAFGQAIDQFQTVQFKLADIETRLQAARVFLRQAAWKLDTGAPDAAKHCAMAKRLVTDEAFDTANDALQLLGGYGYLSDYGIEKIVRDLRVHQILEGTNEIMRLIISRALLEERSLKA
ncbi:MAG: acyl-CoA dehydrogenase family protein [Rhodospirillales bacterium]